MDERKKQHPSSAIPGSLLNTYVYYCALAYIEQKASAELLVFIADCLTKAQEQDLVAFFRDWVQRLPVSSDGSSVPEPPRSVAEQTRTDTHPSLTGWYWSILLWLSVLKHQPECAEPWAVVAVHFSLQQLNILAARTHVKEGSWDRRGVVASIVSLLAEVLCRQSLPQELLLPLFGVMMRLLQREGPKDVQAAAEAACTRLQTLGEAELSLWTTHMLQVRSCSIAAVSDISNLETVSCVPR